MSTKYGILENMDRNHLGGLFKCQIIKILLKQEDRKSILKRFFQGLLFSFTLLLPGISGGTVLLILGFYEQVLADLVSLRIKPYLTFGTA